MAGKLRKPKLRLVLAVRNLEERFITVNGVTIRYVVAGGSAPLLLIHGFGAFIENWWLNIGPLSQHYQVHALDLPGHGLSDRPEVDYALPFFTKLIVGFMDAVGIERTSVLGHSLGGVVSLDIAINFPERVDKLILEDSVGFGMGMPWRYRFFLLPVVGETLMLPTTRATVKHGLTRSFYDPDVVIPEMVEINYQFLKLPGTKQAMLNLLRSNKKSAGIKNIAVIRDKLRSVKSPTLLIHGAHDRTIPLARAQESCSMIPNARLEVFEECGHCPNIERAPEFNEAVIAFLGEKSLVKEV